MSRHRSTFKLGSYVTSASGNASVPERIVVTKGGIVKTIDLTDLRSRIKRLRQNHNLEVKSLTGKLADDYNTLLSHITLLYDTPEYTTLFKEVKKVFEDVKEPNPGTIGAYCAGCLNQPDQKACSVICTGVSQNGPLPRPKSENGLQFCDYPVFWGVFSNGGYKFTDMNVKKEKTDAIVYLEAPLVHGFNQEEKNYFKKAGIHRVQLIHTPTDGKEYKEINQGFIEIDRLPERTVIATNKPAPVASVVESEKRVSPTVRPEPEQEKEIKFVPEPVKPAPVSHVAPAKPVAPVPVVQNQTKSDRQEAPIKFVPENVVKEVQNAIANKQVAQPRTFDGTSGTNFVWFLFIVAIIIILIFFAMRRPAMM